MDTEKIQIVAEAPSPQAPKTAIALNEAGAIQPATFDEAYRMAQMYLSSKMLPARFDTPAMVLTAMQFAKELRLPGLTSLRQIAVVQGSPCLFGDLPLTLVLRDGNMEWIKEYWIDDKGKRISHDAESNALGTPVAAICIAKRKGDKEPIERSFSMDEAKRAGLENSPTWKKYPKTMLKYRARSQVLKDKFADSLNGVAIAEHDYHISPTEESPKLLDTAGDLNAEFCEDPNAKT